MDPTQSVYGIPINLDLPTVPLSLSTTTGRKHDVRPVRFGSEADDPARLFRLEKTWDFSLIDWPDVSCECHI